MPAGTGTWYLVRDENACGTATFGDGTGSPDPRDALDAALPVNCLCPFQRGGALITFRMVTDTLTVWITNSAFIDEAKSNLNIGRNRIPIFNRLINGQACDAQWTWHVDPQDVSFGDAAIEVCDGLPSHIEADKNYWLFSLGIYCPWSAELVAVDDRR